jgi:hypothetical protein
MPAELATAWMLFVETAPQDRIHIDEYLAETAAYIAQSWKHMI